MQTKVVDKSGKPKVMYHGTNEVFTTFKKTSFTANGKKYGPGFYFTDNIEQAKVWGKHIKKAYLVINNPLYNLSPKDAYAKENGIQLPNFGSSTEVFKAYNAIKQEDIDNYLKLKKYDGIIIEDGYHGYEVVVFSPNQIKIINKENISLVNKILKEALK